jgi:uncharacterized protein YndB with AHSA1/START domain
MLVRSSVEAIVTLPSEREIRFTSILPHRRRLVFEAWTKPEHLRRWWGCEGGTLSICEVDLRIGGAWRLVMRMPDGSEHPFKGLYREIVPSERLVYTECYDNPQIGSPEWLTTITFEDANDKTKLTHTVLHASREARDGHLSSGMKDGAQHQMRRLDEHVGEMETER